MESNSGEDLRQGQSGYSRGSEEDRKRNGVRQTMGIQRVEHLVGDVRVLSFIPVYMGHWRILSRGVT